MITRQHNPSNIARRIIAAIGGGLYYVPPYKRPFSLLDLSISYPYIPESITTAILVVVGLIAPGAIIAIVALVFVPGFRFSRQLSRAQIIRLKLWELEKGLAGLALAVAMAFFVTQGLKNLFGKPRPDMLDRCQPDLNNIAEHVLGGYGQRIDERWTLVSATICTNEDDKVLNDGFRSWPSGHSTFSFAGLMYLSLFLCSKFAIWIPHLPTLPYATNKKPAAATTNGHGALPFHEGPSTEKQDDDETHDETAIAAATKQLASSPDLRHQAASPPNYLIMVAFFPIAVAFYISATRFFEFYHFGFDIISGSLIGIISAWVAFRWYHLPLGRGNGWAWGERSPERAFGIGVGVGNYSKAEASVGQVV